MRSWSLRSEVVVEYLDGHLPVVAVSVDSLAKYDCRSVEFDCCISNLYTLKYNTSGMQHPSKFFVDIRFHFWWSFEWTWSQPVIRVHVFTVALQPQHAEISSPNSDTRFHVWRWFSMSIALWHYPSIPTWPVWLNDSKTVLRSVSSCVTDPNDTNNR